MPEDWLPGGEQLVLKPGRRGCHIREDTNIEPVFMHTLSHEFHEELIHSLCIHAMVDGTPGSGAAAFACISKRIPYLGFCLSDSHKELLMQRLIHLILKEMEKEDSPLHETGMVKSETQAQAGKRPAEEAEANAGQGGQKRPGVINVRGDAGNKRTVPKEPDDEESDQGE